MTTKRPQPKGGSRKGKPNKTTALLKEAILLAAENVGQDGKGKDGLTGYLMTLAKSQPKAFAGLLGRVLPLQLTGEGGAPIPVATMQCTPAEFAQVAAEVAGKV